MTDLQHRKTTWKNISDYFQIEFFVCLIWRRQHVPSWGPREWNGKQDRLVCLNFEFKQEQTLIIVEDLLETHFDV